MVPDHPCDHFSTVHSNLDFYRCAVCEAKLLHCSDDFEGEIQQSVRFGHFRDFRFQVLFTFFDPYAGHIDFPDRLNLRNPAVFAYFIELFIYAIQQ